VFIGAKLLLAPVIELPPSTSLAMILASVTLAVALSIRKSRREMARAPLPPGPVSPEREPPDAG
jgi:hypothetical protein